MKIWDRVKAAGHVLRTGVSPLDLIEVKRYESTPGFSDARSISREDAVDYIALARCISLISTGASSLVASTLRVVDAKGDLQTGRRAREAARLLRHSPDGVHTGAEFFRDLIGDYLLDGNALVRVVRAPGSVESVPTRVDRLDAAGATTQIGAQDDGLASLVYRATPFGMHREGVYPARSVAHAKYFPRPAKYSSGGRSFFSRSPLSMMRRGLSIGRRSDAWVDAFFDESARNDIAIEMPIESSAEQMDRNLEAYAAHQLDKRSPLWLDGGAQAKILRPTPQNADALALREYGVQEIGRFYGVPAPLLGHNVTQWGSGIEQLARLYFRYGVRMHIDPVLDVLSFRLLPEGLRFEIDPTQEIKGDTAAMTAFVAAMRPSTNNPGVASQEEVRDLLGLRGKYQDDWGWEPGESGGQQEPTQSDMFPPAE